MLDPAVVGPHPSAAGVAGPKERTRREGCAEGAAMRVVMIFGMMLAACTPASVAPSSTPEATPSPTATATPSPTPEPTPEVHDLVIVLDLTDAGAWPTGDTIEALTCEGTGHRLIHVLVAEIIDGWTVEREHTHDEFVGHHTE